MHTRPLLRIGILHGALALALTANAAAQSVAASAPDAEATLLSGPARWADSARIEIETAHARADLDRLGHVRAMLERALTRWPDHPDLLHYQGYALYREAALRQYVWAEKDVDPILERAQEVLERANDLGAYPETRAILASVLGQRIASSPMIRGMTMGPRSGRLFDQALEAAPENPRIWLLSGMSAIFRPKVFGGGLEKAESEIRRAIELFETDAPAPPAPAWGRGEAWLWLGQVLQRQGRVDEARAAYVKALEYQPGNPWIQETLLPALDGGH